MVQYMSYADHSVFNVVDLPIAGRRNEGNVVAALDIQPWNRVSSAWA